VRAPELTPPEQRVLGSLIEKRWTTPDTYPLSLNSLRLACNQTTSREPVTDYDEATIREGAQRLARQGLARLASGAGSRAVKYRHLAEEALGLGRPELAVLCVLLLRGSQTLGELKARTERMARFESLEEVERVLELLSERGYVERLGRRPGQKEERFSHLLSADGSLGGPEIGAESPVSTGSGEPIDPVSAGEHAIGDQFEGRASPVPAGAGAGARVHPSTDPTAAIARLDDLAARLRSLEAEVTALRADVEGLRESG
jgi:uncharacterized protein YceH (UPF0502 family)